MLSIFIDIYHCFLKLRVGRLVMRSIDLTEGYAIAVGGILLILVLVESLSHLGWFFRTVYLWISKHLIYPYALRRHRGIGPWSRATVLIQLAYITAKMICLSFRNPSLSEAGPRAGNLSLINLIPVFAGPHHGFLAERIGLSLSSLRRVHRSASLTSFSLALFHVLVTVANRKSFPLSRSGNIFTVIVSKLALFGTLIRLGCVGTSLPRAPLVAYLSNTFLRALPLHPPSPRQALCVFHVATLAFPPARSPPLPVRICRTIHFPLPPSARPLLGQE